MDSNQFTFNNILDNLEKWMSMDVINPSDIPSIELYMDQVTTFMDKELSGTKRHPDDKILTKTMINNYSKNDLLPPSDKKKYSKDHIILLIYIYYMKNFLSINDIQTLLKPMTDNHFTFAETDDSSKNSNNVGADEGSVDSDASGACKSELTMSDIYSDIFAIVEQYKSNLKENIDEVCEIADKEFTDDPEYLKAFAMVSMLSYDIYIKKQLIERLIDSITPDTPDKSAIKEAAKEKAAKEKAAAKAEKAQRKQMEKQSKK